VWLRGDRRGVGIAGAAATSRLLGDLLHDVGPLDPLTFIATPLLLMTIAVLASLIPGWRRRESIREGDEQLGCSIRRSARSAAG
jgi:hypothetical protein